MKQPHKLLRIGSEQITNDGTVFSFVVQDILQADGTSNLSTGFTTPKIPYVLRAYAYERFAQPYDSPSGLGGALIVIDKMEWTIETINPVTGPNPGIFHSLQFLISARVWGSQGATAFEAPLLGDVNEFPVFASALNIEVKVEYQLP